MTDVSLDLDAEFKLLTGQTSAGMPVISSRKIATQVRVINGEWAVVAGLLSTSEAHTIAGLPIGPLRPKTRNRDTSEILILIRTTFWVCRRTRSDHHTDTPRQRTRPRVRM